ncbi:MAG TPA: Mrp/NBP35 family ATP-binding protein, partial [Burkholderiales bacterium]|nr:Mrp/NBP35 family ATP-binding protein [Burkholderiales bacterium]
MSVSEADVQSALSRVVDPNTGKDFSASRALKNVKVDGGKVSVEIELGYPGKSQFEPIRRMVIDALKGAGAPGASVNVRSKVVSHAVQRGVKLVPGIKNIIAVASGKGGVGKSTTAVNLALALAAEGATVGMLDADIYGPSQQMMLGIEGRPQIDEQDEKIVPMERHGIKTMSLGLITDPDTPVIWRGPMVMKAIDQFLTDVKWGNLDFMIIDLPPGTGDAQLTLTQKAGLTGAVVVTTPQDVALIDARKGLAMFRKVNVPVLGIVENMSYYLCRHCGEREEIFGHGGGRKTASMLGVPFL